MSFFSCTVEISNSSSSVLLDPEMYLPSGQCSVPLSPLLRPGSSGGASFTSPAGIDLMAVFTYNLPNKRAMLAVWFSVPSARSNGSNYFQVEIIDPTLCDKNLLQLMTKRSEKGTLSANKASVSCNGLGVRATMSDTANAVLKVDVSDVVLYDKGEK